MKKVILLLTCIFFSCEVKILDYPKNILASTKDVGFILLNWDMENGATGYNVYRSDSQTGEYKIVNDKLITDNKYFDRTFNIENGAIFWYKIEAVEVDIAGKIIIKSLHSDAIRGISPAFNATIGDVKITDINFTEKDGMFNGTKISWDKIPYVDYYTILKEKAGEYLVVTSLKEGSNVPLLITDGSWTDFFPTAGINRYKIVPYKINPTGGVDYAGKSSVVVSFELPVMSINFTWKTNVAKTIFLEWDSIANSTNYKIVKNVDNSTTDILTANNSYADLNLNVGKKYSYSLFSFINIVGKIGENISKTATLFFDCNKTVTCYFFQLTELTISNGEFSDKITLDWINAKEDSISDYTIYRQKIQTKLVKNGNDITYPETQYSSAIELKNNSVETFSNRTFVEMNRLLKIATVSALDGEGKRLSKITYEDKKTGNEKVQPGLYRYYVVANNGVFITNTGYRSITDKEFIQEVNRHLDRAIRCNTTSGNTVNTETGGSYRYVLNTSGATWWRRIYEFNNFKSDFLNLTSENFRDNCWKYHIAFYWFTQRSGNETSGQVITSKLYVAGIYKGEIEFYLAREFDNMNTFGGARKATWAHCMQEKDLSYGTETSYFQGWYKVIRNGAEASIRWCDGSNKKYDGADKGDYQNNNATNGFDKTSDAQEFKVEPDWDSDYIIWE